MKCMRFVYEGDKRPLCGKPAFKFVVLLLNYGPVWIEKTFWPYCKEHVMECVSSDACTIENINDFRGYLKAS